MVIIYLHAQEFYHSYHLSNSELKILDVKPHSLMVFDRAYNHYLQFARWSQNKVFFITRKKSNAKYTIVSTVENQTLKDKECGVNKDQIIELKYKDGKE